MERLWSQKAWQLMLVAAATLGTNLITYTLCFYGGNCYSYQKSLLVTRCEELIVTTKLRSDVFLSAQSSLAHFQALNRSEKRDPNLVVETLLQNSSLLADTSSNMPTESDDYSTDECAPCNDSNMIQNVVYTLPKSSTPTLAQSYGNCDQKQTSTILEESLNELKTIFIITPTYKRSTQKIDLTTMCHTLMNVPNVVWIVIEDAPKPTQLVTNLLQRCKVETVHLLAHTSVAYKVKKGKGKGSKPRGVEQRNAGLTWLRKHYSSENCNGVVYLGDDDNKYDLRLFDEIRKTETASVWKVAWAGGLMWEGPTCRNGRATSWHTAFAKQRALPVDMAAFAVHLCQIIKHPEARVGVNIHGKSSQLGYLETDLLQHFTSRSKVECRGSETEAYVWHSHTSPPPLHWEKKVPSKKSIET